MKIALTIWTCLLLFFCTACDVGTEKKQNAAAMPVPQMKPSLAAYVDTLNKLNKDSVFAIEKAIQLYSVLAPHDSTGADSAASALLRFVQSVVAKANDSLVRENTDFSPLLNPANNTLTDRQKALKSSLHASRLKLVSDGEGGVYIVPSYETILPSVKAKTSAPVDNYLDLVAKEDTTPVFLDAGLAIEMTELVDRLVMSEELMNQPLPKLFAGETARLNRFYTHALVMGADNSASVEYNSTVLNDEFRKGYDYLIAKYPSTKAAANIQVWLAVIASGDRKKIEAFRRTMQ